MLKAIRQHGTTIIVAMITAAITAAAPAIADVTSSWIHLRDKHVKPFADGRYAKKSVLATDDGTVNETTDPIAWTKLKLVPGNLADGDDVGSNAWVDLTGVPAGFADNTDDVGSNAWGDLTGVPAGFADNSDDVQDPVYILNAPPNTVGVPLYLDTNTIDAMCRDSNGCDVTVAMINWNTSQPGNVASRSHPLFISESSYWWRFANIDVEGQDNNSTINEYQAYDCYLTDAETWTGAPNARADTMVGFALLNLAGGTYSDSTTTCRVVVTD